MVFPILCPPPGPKFPQGFFALCKILVRQKQFQAVALRQASDKVSGIEERVVRSRAHSHTSHRNGRPHLLGFKSAERTFCLRKKRTQEKNTNNIKKQKITHIEAVKLYAKHPHSLAYSSPSAATPGPSVECPNAHHRQGLHGHAPVAALLGPKPQKKAQNAGCPTKKRMKIKRLF
jgi:hypothetical protein